MKELEILILLFPVVFMLHDFEEIIFFKPWLAKNGPMLKARFPLLANRLLTRFEGLTTGAFTVAVAEEFVLFSAVSFWAVWSGYYLPWLGLLTAFTLHLVVHLAQWVAVRRYVPVLVTSFLALPYCIYAISRFAETGEFPFRSWLLWSVAAVAVGGFNLLLAHGLAARSRAGNAGIRRLIRPNSSRVCFLPYRIGIKTANVCHG